MFPPACPLPRRRAPNSRGWPPGGRSPPPAAEGDRALDATIDFPSRSGGPGRRAGLKIPGRVGSTPTSGIGLSSCPPRLSVRIPPCATRLEAAVAATREERPHRLEPSRRLSGFRVSADAISALRVHAVVSPQRPDRKDNEETEASHRAHNREDRARRGHAPIVGRPWNRSRTVFRQPPAPPLRPARVSDRSIDCSFPRPAGASA